MSILIKGIDMPKCSNEDIIAVIRHNGNVEVWQTGYKERIVEAIQIHTSQGRLIEGRLIDEFEKNLYEYIDPYEIPGAIQALYEALDDAQQYIEAEE